MAVIVPIVSKFDANGVKQAEAELSGLSAVTAATGNAFRSAFVPATLILGGVVAGLKGATEAAIEDASSQDALSRQLSASTSATSAQVAAVEDYISAQSRLTATADDELRPALAQLVRATGDVSKAQKLLSLAQDIAAGSGKDLQTVTLALSKAVNGQVGALARLGVPLDKAAVKSKDLNAITEQLAKTFGGAAQRQAQTAEGRIRGFSVALNEAKESIGYGFMPIISALLPFLQRLSDFIANNTRLILIGAASMASFAAAIVTVNVAMKAYAVGMQAVSIATRTFNLIIKTSPVVRFGLIIAAVVTALYALQATSQDTAKALQVFGRVAVTIIGGAGAIVAEFSKVVAAGAYIVVKAVEQLAKVSDFVFHRDDAKKIHGVSDAINRAGQSLNTFENQSLKLANSNIGFPQLLDRSAKAIKAVQEAASKTTPNIVSGSLPTFDAVSNAATKSGAKAADKVKQASAKIAEAAKKAQEATATRIKAATDHFRTAFTDFSDRGLRAFDAETSRLIDQIGTKLNSDLDLIDRNLKAKIGDITAYYAGQVNAATLRLTAPSANEIELRRLENLRDQEQATRDLRDAQSELDRVRADSTATVDDIRRAEERLSDVIGQQAIDKLRAQVDEEKRVRDEQLSNLTDSLTQQRDAAIAFAEKQANDQIEAAKFVAAEQEKQLTAQRELERESLQSRLDTLEKSLEQEPAIWQTAHDRLIALFGNSFGPDYMQAGANLGDAFVTGLARSLSRLAGQATMLTGIKADTLGGPATASAQAPELNLIVNAGFGTNGAAVGNSIVNALQDWQRRNGALPLRVSG